jgi:serine phosphatase RsbU (regulator of sigma subunit)
MPKPATILVVDDSPVNLQVLVRTLDGTGHRILAATNGISALQIATRIKPDLILLDVMMPEMDGFEVCRRIKSDPAICDVAVIFLSALGDVGDKVAGLELGAVDYITKPIQAEEVLARVAAHLIRLQLEREVRQSRDSLDRELGAAAAMQRLILPRSFPSIGSLNFAAYYQTSRYVGGDYFDVIRLPENRCGILVADVSGHGAPSAIVMAMIRAAFHAYSQPAIHPAPVLRYLNEQFRFLWGTSMLATLAYSVIDESGRMSLSCAGHPPPLLIRNAEVCEIVSESTIPLLLMEIADIPTTEHQLHPGDRLLFYTDGIIERENAAGEMYEVHGVQKSLSQSHHLESEELMKSLVKDLERFADGTEPNDDQTLLLVTL